ncbi:hypothetical protein ABIB94_004094 [Bradyrhizobium sp. JR7.2]|jgi:hypothetical protein
MQEGSDVRTAHIYFKSETNSNDWTLEELKADARLTNENGAADDSDAA